MNSHIRMGVFVCIYVQASRLTGIQPLEFFSDKFFYFLVLKMSKKLDSIRDKVSGYLPQVMQQQDLDMMFMMMTNIARTSTELLCCGPHAELIVRDAFGIADGEDHIILKDIVSRKKQFLPTFVEALHQ